MDDLRQRIARLDTEKRALLERLFMKETETAEEQEPIPQRRTSGHCVLSFGQERLWFIDQLEPESSIYNIPLAVQLTGQLNVAALQQCIGEILRRHEVLRTTFVIDNDQPIQIITSQTAFTLPQIDLSTVSEEQKQAKAQQLAREEESRPFDLVMGPLLRAVLVRLKPEEHVLLLTMHHIVSDGWSVGILYRELSVLYDAFSKGNLSPLPQLPIQYADFAVWQRNWLKGEVLEKQLSFWIEHLQHISPLELPTDHPRPAVQTFDGATHTIQFPQTLTEALQVLSRKEGVTLFMTLLAAFQSLLHRYTGQEDIVVGTPIANRNRTEIEGLIGFFVNTLVMRTDTSGDPVFRELLKRVRKTTLDAYTHQDLPFEKLVEELRPERDLSRNPLFQVLFALQNVPLSRLELSGLTLSRMVIENTKTRFDLEVHFSETEEGLKGEFIYSTDLFDSSTVERMAGHYQKIVEGIVVNADQRLSELPLLTETERHRLLVEWNGTRTEYPKDLCIHELFEAQVEKTPHAIAVVFEDHQTTYRELNNKANQLAQSLRKQGVGPEVLVGLCVERSVDMVVAMLGILKAGGAYVPLDPNYPPEWLAFVLEDTKTPLVITQTSLLPRLPQHSAIMLCVDHAQAVLQWQQSTSSENPRVRVTPSNLAYVIYTSGSTGRPKGVAIEHHGPANLVNWARDFYSSAELSGVLASTSICFDLSVFELFATLCNGGTVILAENALQLSSLPVAQQVTLLNTVPSAMKELLRVKALPPSVQTVNLAGEPLSLEVVQQLYQLPGIEKVYDLYGPSETTTYSTFALRRPDGPCTIGRPLANTQVYLLDAERDPVPIAVPGELYIGGDGLARDYLNRSELTAERFLPDPFHSAAGARLYRTGDLARYLPDGNIEFLGRIDHQVKIRGFRVEPGEIEAALRGHAAVKDVVVVAREDGLGEKRLVAYIVASEEPELTDELRRLLKKRLPEYMVPSAFMVMEALPLTLNGKVDRKALPDPGHLRPELENAYVAPRTQTEVALVDVWREVLGIEKVGVFDNFFELGGHSLLATQVVSRLRKVFQVELPLRSLFESPTVEGLARTLHMAGKPEQLERRAALFLRVAGLSENEVNTMLENRFDKKDNESR
ncbi:MAG TPA: non-ribosomal peptide synthetase [Nitrospiraceae bacterium]|jgi:amino acid adenylation domain-containing protein|nr:non-ribosomal peptide synthetase [Nitrospiraceae bacterium]